MFIFYLLIVKAAIAYKITDVYLEDGSSTLEGSKSGGTKLVFSADWPKIYANNFEIFIGDSECKIRDSPVETQVLSCFTPPQPQERISEYPISVYFVTRFHRFGDKIGKTFKYTEGTKIN